MSHSSLATAVYPVKNFFEGRQKPIRTISVHHMAGRATAQACANTLNNRGVSAHYGIGVNGEIASYVEEENTAWSLGDRSANYENISIETSNSATGGDWPVSDKAYNSMVQLVADIAKRNNLGELKVGENLVMHKMYKATNCPGPYLEARFQHIADIANGLNGFVEGESVSVEEVPKKSVDEIANEVIAGKWGNGEARKINLANAGYDYAEVQTKVNAKLGTKAQPVRKSNDTIANEVIAGLWGNGNDRKVRLQSAGYNYSDVQAIVNKKLGVK